jgi:hypothetical protein
MTEEDKATSTKDSTALLKEYLSQWEDLFARRLEERTVSAWIRAFSGYRPSLLRKALEQVTDNAKKFPVPGILTEAIKSLRAEDAGAMADEVFGSVECHCPKCDGQGHYVITLPEPNPHRYRKAVRCDCHPYHYTEPSRRYPLTRD